MKLLLLSYKKALLFYPFKINVSQNKVQMIFTYGMLNTGINIFELQKQNYVLLLNN